MKAAAPLGSNDTVEQDESLAWSNVLDEADTEAIALGADGDDQGARPDEHSMLSASHAADDVSIDVFDDGLEYPSPYASQKEHEEGHDAIGVRMEPSCVNGEFGQWAQQFGPENGIPTFALADLSAQLAVPFGVTDGASLPQLKDEIAASSLLGLPLINIAHVFGGYVSSRLVLMLGI